MRVTNFEKILPAGSIVTLNIMKEEKKDTKFIIMKRFVAEESGVNYYYEYEVMVYPTGSKDGKNLLINNEQIEEIIFKGYKDRLEEEFLKESKNIIQTNKLIKKVVKMKGE